MNKGLKEVTRRPDLFFQMGVMMGTTKKLHTMAIAVGAPVSPDQFESNLMSCAENAFEQGGQEDILVLVRSPKFGTLRFCWGIPS